MYDYVTDFCVVFRHIIQIHTVMSAFLTFYKNNNARGQKNQIYSEFSPLWQLSHMEMKHKHSLFHFIQGCSHSVLVLSLPLCFVVVGVAAVQLVKHLSDSHRQSGHQKLDIQLHAQVQDLIDPLS